jgi:hypothetical protein
MTTQIAGVQLGLPLIVAAAAAAQFILLALIAMVAPVRMKKPLAVSIGLLVVGWGFAFDAKSMMKSEERVAQASTMGEARSQGSCASIRNAMSGTEVRKKLGVPDEVRNDDKVRGPGSTVLIYKDLRCAVHLFDERVELVD